MEKKSSLEVDLEIEAPKLILILKKTLEALWGREA